MSRWLVVLALVLGIGIAPAAATNESPDCHGQNQEECRDDPQPDHGADCEHSADHRCATTTTTTAPPVTIVTDPTTTTTVPVATSTTTAAPAPAAQVSHAPATEVQGVTETKPAKTLPRTGTGAGALAAVGTFAGILGLLLAYASRTRAGGAESRRG